MSRYSTTERLGVNETESIILKEIKWIFREQPIVDMGIDAHIEIVNEGLPTGTLIAVQIKTGISHFKDQNDELVYYGKNEHLNYWLNHTLPVILVAHLPDENKTYWVHVNKENITKTPKAWKISIKKSNILNSSSKIELENITKNTTKSEQKQQALFLAKPLIEKLNNGGKLIIETDEYHNKSLGRSNIKLFYIDENGNKFPEKEWRQWYTGYSIEELFQNIYPWADISTDNEFYQENFCQSFYSVYTDLYIEHNNIFPYKVLCGEVSLYRLELKLNILGQSFLNISNYLDS